MIMERKDLEAKVIQETKWLKIILLNMITLSEIIITKMSAVKVQEL